MAERGVIYNREKKRRLMSFASLRYNKITPTDIDAFLDFGGRGYVVIEAKGIGVPVPTGQRIALERLLLKLSESPSLAIVIIAETPDGSMEDDVDLGACEVREVWHVKNGRKLRSTELGATVKEIVDRFKSWVDCEHIKF